MSKLLVVGVSMSVVMALAARAGATCSSSTTPCYQQTNSGNGVAIRGTVSAAGGGYGVQGIAAAAGVGVSGQAQGDSGTGVQGNAGPYGTGVQGSAGYYGVLGTTTQSWGAGVAGYSSSSGGNGVAGYVNPSGWTGYAVYGSNYFGYAAYFDGYAEVTRGLYVDDFVYAHGFSTWSDARLKKDVASLESGLAVIRQLRPVKFHWKTDSASDVLHPGLIAQEVQKVLPEVVTESRAPEPHLAVNYTELIPVLLKGIQEQQARIEEQDKVIQRLERFASADNSKSSASASLQNPLGLVLGLGLFPLGFLFSQRRRRAP